MADYYLSLKAKMDYLDEDVLCGRSGNPNLHAAKNR